MGESRKSGLSRIRRKESNQEKSRGEGGAVQAKTVVPGTGMSHRRKSWRACGKEAQVLRRLMYRVQKDVFYPNARGTFGALSIGEQNLQLGKLVARQRVG